LLKATETELEEIAAATRRERRPLRGQEQIALRIGKVLNHYKMKKHFLLQIEEDSFCVSRNEKAITEEACLDGIYVLRTTVPSGELDVTGVISAYKDLAGVERDFRSMKVIDVDLRPVHHPPRPSDGSSSSWARRCRGRWCSQNTASRSAICPNQAT